MHKSVDYVVIEHNNRVIHSVGVCFQGHVIPTLNPDGRRCFALTQDEALIIPYLLSKNNNIFYDPETRKITNENGEIMFNPQTGISSTYEKDDAFKVYVDSISTEEAKLFLDTLKDIKIKESEFNVLEQELRIKQEELQSKYNEVGTSVEKHVKVVTNLHDKLCKILAISGYNEFRNKIYVDKDGKVFIINKNVEIKLEEV